MIQLTMVETKMSQIKTQWTGIETDKPKQITVDNGRNQDSQITYS